MRINRGVRHDIITIEAVECLLKSLQLVNALSLDQQVLPEYLDPPEVLNYFQEEFTDRDFNSLMTSAVGRGFLLGYVVNAIDYAYQQLEEEEGN